MPHEREKFNTAWIALTYQCNNRCRWCYADSNNSIDRKSISWENLVRIVDLLKDLKIRKIVLIGGEPTLHPEFLPLTRYLSGRDTNFGVVSNGRRFSSESFATDSAGAGLRYATFSFCGKDAQSHDNLTQVRGSFEQSVEGLRNASKAGIKISTNLVINQATKHGLEEFVDRFSVEPIESMGFNICGPCIQDEENNNYLLSPLEGAQAYERVHLYALSKGIKTKLITPTPLCFFSESFRNMPEFKRAVSGGPCQMTTGRNFVVDSSLDVLPCTHLTGFPMFNLRKSPNSLLSPEEFLSKMKDPQDLPYQIRERMSRYPSVKCNDCSSAACAGGCPLYWIKLDPESEITSPLMGNRKG